MKDEGGGREGGGGGGMDEWGRREGERGRDDSGVRAEVSRGLLETAIAVAAVGRSAVSAQSVVLRGISRG